MSSIRSPRLRRLRLLCISFLLLGDRCRLCVELFAEMGSEFTLIEITFLRMFTYLVESVRRASSPPPCRRRTRVRAARVEQS
jgi:hypothetical protein